MTQPAVALVNPSLQPGDLFDRYGTVLVLKIVKLNESNQSAELSVNKVLKGNFTPKTVSLTAQGDEMAEAFFTVLAKDQMVTAFVGKNRAPLEFLLYAGAEGRWQGGELKVDNPALWDWNKDYKKHEFFGTFNGHPSRLAEMMADKADGRLYFPTKIFDQFLNAQLIGSFPKAIHGVAMYDIDGDGQLDIYATSESGDRLYRQSAPLTFTDCTKEVGLDNVASSSVNIADVDGDGRADLLLDAAIWKQSSEGSFSKTDLLPQTSGKGVIHSTFTDINGDGYPDVLLSLRDGGLQLFLNPGKRGGAFQDATKAAGLDRPECGAGGTGWAITGDWNNDGHTAIFYSSGSGILLTQNEHNVFSPVAGVTGYDFKVEGAGPGLTGAGVFAPVWESARPDLLFTRNAGIGIIVNDQGGKTLDGVTYGNEVQTSTLAQLPLIAEDLNADGTMDIYVGSREGKPNMYYLNRNYGSFMVPDRYNPAVFPGNAHRSGAWGLAAGDVNGDGANDLLIGGIDGKLNLLVNNTLASRKPSESSTAMEKKLEQTGIISVHVTGKTGVLGARIILTDANGLIVARRDLGANIQSGSRGPDTANLAVREPGTYKLNVRFSDGFTSEKSIMVKAGSHEVVPVDRGSKL